MRSAFGVDHYDISKMSDKELRHRKRVQAGLSTAGAVVGLSALGAKGAKIGTGKYLKPATKAVKINTKIDNGVNNALVVGGGIGGAAGLNSASISRAESKRQYIHKLDISARGSNQHKRQVQLAVPRITPKQRRHTALAASTGMLAGAGMAAGGGKKKLAVGLIAGGSALSGYAASDPNDYIKEKKMSKSAFGVEHYQISKIDHTKKSIIAGAGTGAASGYAVNQTRHYGLRYKGAGHGLAAKKHIKLALAAKAKGADTDTKFHAIAVEEHANTAQKLVSRAYSKPRKAALIGAGTALGVAAGAHRRVNKAFDPEARRHTQLGAAAGVSGSVAAASGTSALRSAKKARGHFRAASGANQTTKTRLLEGLGLKGAAQVQHARKTAMGHGEMLHHIRTGNIAARRARGKAGIALGTAAAAGAIVHHSNNGAANYAGPYQPKTKYVRGAKKTVARAKKKFS